MNSKQCISDLYIGTYVHR